MVRVEFHRLQEDAQVWQKGTVSSAGYDIYSYSDTVIPAGEQRLVSTKISIGIEEGYCGIIHPRSGLALKHKIDRRAGVIDSDYRGEVFALLKNEDSSDYVIKKGDRIAQILFVKCETVEQVVVDKLSDSVRGAGGFGSTGSS